MFCNYKHYGALEFINGDDNNEYEKRKILV